jgi:hypothetical protein
MKKNLYALMILGVLLSLIEVNAQGFYLNKWEAKTYVSPSLSTSNPLSSGVTPDVTITIDTSNVLAKVLPTQFGSNTTFRNGSDQLSRKNLYTNSGHGIMRFPAGSGSNIYFYDGDIPTYNEMHEVTKKDGTIEYINGINGANSNYMTPDIFADFISQSGSEATIVVNYFLARYIKSTLPETATDAEKRADRVSKAASYAAGFVRKMNIELGANIKYWEIGNECYGRWEEGYNVGGSIVTGTEYGEDLRVFADSMKAVDPTIKIGAVVKDVNDGWNEGVLPEVQNHADFLVVHNYFLPEKSSTAENVLAEVGQIATIHNTLQSAVENNTSKAKDYFPIAMTEFNSRGTQNTTMMNGLFVSQILGELVKNKYGLASIWVSEWNWNPTAEESKGILARNDPDQADYTPRHAYIAYQYYHKCFGDKMVQATSSNSDIKVYASTFSSGEIGIVVVNPTANDTTVQLNLDAITNNSEYDKVYWYDFYGTDMDKGNKKFYINGQTGTTAGGGPANYATLPPYYSNYSTDKIFDSNKYSVQYIVLQKTATVENPVITVNGSWVSLSTVTDGATVYYTTDGTMPTSESTLYSTSFSVAHGTIVKALAINDSGMSSVVTEAVNYSLPFAEDFENYSIGDSFSGDSWLTTNSMWDRMWKGDYVTSYSTEVVDESAISGSQCLLFTINPSDPSGATNIKLRTNLIYGTYDITNTVLKITYRARTDAAGNGRATIGGISTAQYVLTQSYQEFSDVVTVSSDRVFLYFNNTDFATGETYKIWIDDIVIDDENSTSIGEQVGEVPEVIVCPNPAKQEMYLLSEKPISNITIYNMSGVLVYQSNTSKDKIDISFLSKGIYMLQTEVEGVKVVKRIVKK